MNQTAKWSIMLFFSWVVYAQPNFKDVSSAQLVAFDKRKWF
jgi:hypothetical protein